MAHLQIIEIRFFILLDKKIPNSIKLEGPCFYHLLKKSRLQLL